MIRRLLGDDVGDGAALTEARREDKQNECEEAGDGVHYLGMDIPLEITFTSPKPEQSGRLTPMPNYRLDDHALRYVYLTIGINPYCGRTAFCQTRAECDAFRTKRNPCELCHAILT